MATTPLKVALCLLLAVASVAHADCQCGPDCRCPPGKCPDCCNASTIKERLSCLNSMARELAAIQRQNNEILSEIRAIRAEQARLQGMLERIQIPVPVPIPAPAPAPPAAPAPQGPIIVYPPGYGGTPRYELLPGGAPRYELPPGGTPRYELPPGGAPRYELPPGGVPRYELPPGGAPRYEIPRAPEAAPVPAAPAPGGAPKYTLPGTDKGFYGPGTAKPTPPLGELRGQSPPAAGYIRYSLQRKD